MYAGRALSRSYVCNSFMIGVDSIHILRRRQSLRSTLDLSHRARLGRMHMSPD